MYLFSRSARLATGRMRDQMTWALAVTEKVNQITELEVSLWSTVFSPAFGTVAWTAVVEELEVLEASDAKLAVDDAFVSLVDQGNAFLAGGPLDDGLLQILHADEAAADVVPQYATTVAAELAPTKMTRGVEIGIELAQQSTRITGCPTTFGLSVNGPYGQVEWITGYESVAQLQKASETLAADASFAALVDGEASTAYLPRSVVQTTYRRLS